MLSVDGIPSENGIFQEVSQEVKNYRKTLKQENSKMHIFCLVRKRI